MAQTKLDVSPHFSAAFAPILTSNQIQEAHETFPIPLAGLVEKRRLETVSGRILVSEIMEDDFGIANALVARDHHGVPVFPSQLVGSISHCDNWVFATAGISQSELNYLGCDVETFFSESLFKEIKDEFLTSSERAFLEQEKNNLQLATIIFSAKESLYKALFPSVRKFADFQSFSMHAWDDSKRVIYLQTTYASNQDKVVYPVIYSENLMGHVLTIAFG